MRVFDDSRSIICASKMRLREMYTLQRRRVRTNYAETTALETLYRLEKDNAFNIRVTVNNIVTRKRFYDLLDACVIYICLVMRVRHTCTREHALSEYHNNKNKKNQE